MENTNLSLVEHAALEKLCFPLSHRLGYDDSIAIHSEVSYATITALQLDD